MSACSPHLWCTIEPRWFPTVTRQKRKTISRRATIWYHIWKQIHKNTRRRDERTRTVPPICCVGVRPTAGGLHQHGNQARERFNQSHSERESQKLGQRLPVLNWILTGSREYGSCRVSRGFCCCARRHLSWYLAASINFMVVCTISILLEMHKG